MGSVQLRGGLNQATLDQAESGAGLSVLLAQDISSAVWRLRVLARTDDDFAVVGEVDVVGLGATNLGARRNMARVVAIATCPGAREWTVDAQCIDPATGLPADPGGDTPLLTLASSACSAVEAGVVRVNERPAYHAGVAGALLVPAGETIVSWSAYAAGPGAASVALGSGPAIALPIPGGLSGGGGGLVRGPVTLTFTGTDSYYVEVARSG